MNESKTSYKVRGEDLVKKVKDLIHEGNARRLLIKSESGETYLRIPITAGVIGILILPVLAVVGVIAALTGIFIIEVEHLSEEKSVKAPVKAKKKESVV